MKFWQTTIGGTILGLSIGVCGGRLYEHHVRTKTHYRLMVSPDFTLPQQEEVFRAAHKWEQAVGNRSYLTVSVQVGQCPTTSNVVDACITPAIVVAPCGTIKEAVGCTTSGEGWDYIYVWVDVKCGDIHTTSHLLQHEIGHVFGVQDTDQKNVVMHRYIVCSEIQTDATQDVSQTDVAAYMKVKE